MDVIKDLLSRAVISSNKVPWIHKDQLNLQGVARGIVSDQVKNIIVMTGAGISVAAGIPDFRSDGGLYESIKQQFPTVNDPRDLFNIDYFQNDPKPFCTLAKQIIPQNTQPTKVHYFIKLLEKKNILLRNYTQNVDSLERLAGVSDGKLIQAHGSFDLAFCISCEKNLPIESYKEKIFADEIPQCECGGWVKPDVVFFGEYLPEKFMKKRRKDFAKCDLLIVVGTSLAVQPFANLIAEVPDSCVRLLINKDEVGKKELKPTEYSISMGNFGHKNGFLFDEPGNNRDVKWLGDAQDGIMELVSALGWEKEFCDILRKE